MATSSKPTRRHFLAGAAAAAGLATSAQPQPASAPRPNILLILSDDHSAAHVGCYGNPDTKTPNLDRFSQGGVRFDRAYVTCPQCVPSRASIMTGRSPVRIAMTRFSAPLPLDVRTYPEVLRTSGYFTGVAGRNYHLDGSANAPQETTTVLDKYKLRSFPDRLDYVKTGGRQVALSQLQEFLDLAGDRPFFLQLCSNDPHRPLDKNAIPSPHDPSRLKLPPHYPDTQLVREDFARYYDEISRFDGDVGEILKVLEQRNLAGNTLVAIMGDNGASQFRGKGTLYEFGIRVPLLIRWPGRVKPGWSSDRLISGEDLAPTFLEAAGLQPPGDMTGRSFLNLLQGRSYTGRTHVFSERGAHGSTLPVNSANFDLGRCIVTPTHKLIYNALWQIPYWPVDFAGDPHWKELMTMHEQGKLSPELSRLYFSPTRPMFELYELTSDPYELRNLAGQAESASIERDLKAALQEWMILERDYVPLPVPPPPRR
ncbi:MAG: twin-arginine translocation signal domain-containing protein [Acidobacteria bacterium]|nr:MAG: twin-arginine translocation signal domain-containing protein [Acidobacteriota bacterium]